MISKAIFGLTALVLPLFIMTGNLVMAEEKNLTEPASSEDAFSDDEAEMRRLLSIIEKHTEIATKTKMNADFVPGMVTVLRGEDLEARGARTVKEALELVPGIELTMDNLYYQFVARGIGKTFQSGNIKFLLDGIPMNLFFFGLNHAVIEIPVEHVERIEVIRGPGSAVHGEFAYAGVVNVITRKDGNRLFGGLGSYDTYEGGSVLSWTSEDGEFGLNLNLFRLESDGPEVEAEQDILHGMGMGAISNAPGPSNEAEKVGSAACNLDYGDFSVAFNYFDLDVGDFFGVAALPPPGGRHTNFTKHMNSMARLRLDFTPDLRADFKLGWHENEIYGDRIIIFPPGFAGIYPDGVVMNVFIRESKFFGGIDLAWDGWDRHTALLGWSAAKFEMEDLWQELNYHPATWAPYTSMQRIYSTVDDRVLNSFTLQDEFRINDSFTLTGGLRYDTYSDVGDAFTPRISAVWRVTETHILKCQYSKAFRPPTGAEMQPVMNSVAVGNKDIEPAIIDTYELGYIRKGKNTVCRLTLFHSDLDDLIVVDNGKYANSGSAEINGMELELELELGRYLKLDGNYAYVDTEDKDTGEEIAGIANHLANIGLMFQPLDSLSFQAQYKHVGPRGRESGDARSKLDGYGTADITASLLNLGGHGLTFRAGVKNLFDEDVRYPAPLGRWENHSVPTYPEDYPRPGRNWWARFSLEF